MRKLTLRPEWVLSEEGGARSLTTLLALCAGVRDSGNLVEACRRAGVSYRHGWGMLRDMAALFGVALVHLERGRGATLTAFGEKLLWADQRAVARLGPVLESLASEVQGDLERALSLHGAGLRIHASHGFAIAALHETLVEQGMPVELNYVSSQDAIASLDRGGCDLAGLHVPLGDLQQAGLRAYEPWLFQPDLVVIHLARRRQGVMVPRGNPRGIEGVRDLTRPDLRFVNRQPGSGTRMLLQLLLSRQNIDARAIPGWETVEFTHAAVAAYVASGMADAGFGIEMAARKFKLDFVPVADERYFLACHARGLETDRIRQVLATLRSEPFHRRVNSLPGYNARECGMVMTSDQAFGAGSGVSLQPAAPAGGPKGHA